jgi:hypothetical protein
VEKLEAAALEFAYEIYDGDKLLIVGYDDNAEIVSDWTDDSKRIATELKNFHKKGDPTPVRRHSRGYGRCPASAHRTKTRRSRD